MSKKIIKRIGLGLVAVVGVFVLAAVVMWGLGKSKLQKQYQVEVKKLNIPSDSASIARGKYLAVTNLCMDCHGQDLSGQPMMEDPAFGVLSAVNLTSGSGGIGREYQVDDWVRAIRHGVNRQNQSLWMMPSEVFAKITDRDLAMMIAYLRQVPAVDKEHASRQNGPIMTLISSFSNGLLAAEKIPPQLDQQQVAEPGITAEYGEYLAITCHGCHGEDLTGGLVHGPPGTAPSRNITPHPVDGIGNWSKEDFFASLRDGKRPDGSDLTEAMPRALGQMNDADLDAIWLYLQTVKPMRNKVQ